MKPRVDPFVVARRRGPREDRPRLLDWRFWVALAGLLMVAYLVVGGYQDNVAKGKRIDTLISLTKAKDDRAEAAAVRASRAQAAASKERDALLANQRELLQELRRLENRQERTLAYLAEQGLPPPTAQELERVSPPTNRNGPGPTDAGGGQTRPKEQETRPRPTRPGGAAAPPETPPPGQPGPPEERPRRNPVRDLLDNLLPPLLRR